MYNMIQGLDSALNFSNDVIKLFILLLILPYVLGFILNWIYSFLGFIFRFGYEPKYSTYKRSRRTTSIGRLVSLITLPGTLLRISLLFLFLKLKGWVLSVAYPGFVGVSNRSLSDPRRTGFFITMRPHNRRKVTFKEMVQASMIGYIPLFLGYYMWKTRGDQIDFLIYLQQGNLNLYWIYIIYYYLLFAIIIGGALIPEETMLPIYFLIGKYPHLLLGLLCSYIISFLISLMELGYLGFEGNRLAETYFLLFSAILFFKVLIDEKQLRITKKDLDERLLELELIELL